MVAPTDGEFSVAEVIVDVHARDVDRVFHYLIPDALQSRLHIGHRVAVPFGRQRRVEGYVIGLLHSSPWSPLRPVQSLLDPTPVFDEAALHTAKRAADHYLTPLVQMLQCFIPPGVRLRAAHRVQSKKQRFVRLSNATLAADAIPHLEKRAPKQAALLQLLLEAKDGLPAAALLHKADAPNSSLQSLASKQLVELTQEIVRRNPFSRPASIRPGPPLTDDQTRALASIATRMDSGQGGTVLLQGVTGSGKTEVYLRAIAHGLATGKGAIFLVPEISLTPQMIEAFRRTFADDVALLHSRLSPGERYDEWQRLLTGEASIVVGARSAVFAPVKNLGLIILDEEHETSYKQDESPAYHARTVARWRKEAAGAVLVVGSATPDVQTRYEAESGGARLLLPHRIGQRALPTTHIVDMREELKSGNRSMFSRALVDRLESTFVQGEQAMLFMNRRGYASFVLCRECGYVPRCRRCDVSLTFHLPSRMLCHYCQEESTFPGECPQCTSKYLRPFGGGTQRIQDELQRRFPGVKALRMDVDTTTRKGAHEKIIDAFASKTYDCLIGTQMIAKGLHFPGVTTVGVISADTSLFWPDYRAAERTFQLLTQVAGRAGRGDEPGEVIIQTYAPDHYAVVAAAQHDYEGFYQQEIGYRRRMAYPPFAAVARALWTGENDEDVLREADARTREIMFDTDGDVDILGPTPCPLSKINNRFRFQTMIQGEREAVMARAAKLLHQFDTLGDKRVRLHVDVDPLNFM